MTLKYQILREKPTEKFLLYREDDEPVNPVDNWLLDVQLAHYVFSDDQVTIWAQELGLGTQFHDLIRSHSEFFQSESRRNKLQTLLGNDNNNFTISNVSFIMLSVCASSVEESLDPIIENLLQELSKKKDGKIKCLITGRWRQATREEYVRQGYCRTLLEVYKYPKENIDVEFRIFIGSQDYPADIVVFNSTTKAQDNVYIVVETKNMHGIPETIYLGNALKVIERPIELLTFEEKSKFKIIYEPELKVSLRPDMNIEPDMDMLSMDPEPVVSKVTCGKGTILKDNLCIANEMSFYFFFKQFTRLFG